MWELLQDSGKNILVNDFFYHFIFIHALSTDFPTPPLPNVSSIYILPEKVGRKVGKKVGRFSLVYWYVCWWIGLFIILFVCQLVSY